MFLLFAENRGSELLVLLPDHREKAPDVLPEETDSIAKIHELFGSLLNERERLVLTMRYGLGGGPQSWKDIAAAIGRTKQRAKQIEVKALAKLRDALDNESPRRGSRRSKSVFK